MALVRCAAGMLGWNLKRLAVEAGLNHQRVQRLFRGERIVRPDDLRALRHAVGLDK
jgi:transcriptional regulator with XRE-family HTH domain